MPTASGASSTARSFTSDRLLIITRPKNVRNGDNCLIGSGVVIAPGERVPDNTVIVSVDTPLGVRTRVVREQMDYLVRAHEAIIQKYVDSLTNPKSADALEKHHGLVPASQA